MVHFIFLIYVVLNPLAFIKECKDSGKIKAYNQIKGRIRQGIKKGISYP